VDARIPQMIGTNVTARGNESTYVNRFIKRSATALLVSAGLACAGSGAGEGVAQANPNPAPLYPGPFHTDNGDWGAPRHWCPGQPLPDTGNHVTDPIHWDMTVCHTYFYVWMGMGNASNVIWDGDNPPPKPPPPVGLYCAPDLTNCRIGNHP
jgi:hypothetical protein